MADILDRILATIVAAHPELAESPKLTEVERIIRETEGGNRWEVRPTMRKDSIRERVNERVSQLGKALAKGLSIREAVEETGIPERTAFRLANRPTSRKRQRGGWQPL